MTTSTFFVTETRLPQNIFCQKNFFLNQTLLPLSFFLALLLSSLSQSSWGHLDTNDFQEMQAGYWQRGLTRAGTYTPPTQDDVTFIQSSIGVNQKHYSSDGPINIPIIINRYFGDAEERARQIATGGIPRTLKLIMPAWDVDSNTKSKHQPECDQVYFNDKFIGTLQGTNNTWKINIFSVSIEDVHFPETPGSTAATWVRIDVDVNNPVDIWLTSINWVALMIPAPRPIMLVHGWLSNSDTWRNMQQTIKKAVGVPTVAIDLDPLGSLFHNAYMLQYELEEWRQAYAVQEFNIMAHSKGGLDSRCYTNSNTHPTYAHDVHRVLQIATPNAGSQMADLLYDYHHLTLGQQLFLTMFISMNELIKIGTWHITTEFTKEFNYRCAFGRSRAPLSVVAGRVPNRPFWLFNFPFLDIAEFAYNHNDNSFDPARWGDGVVSVASAHKVATARSASPLRGANCDHLDMINAQSSKVVKIYHDDLIEQKKPTYQPENYHQPIDYRGAAATDFDRQEVILSRAEASADNQEQITDYPWKAAFATWNGILEPGQSASCEFFLAQPQEISFLFLGVTPELPISVTTPEGIVLSSLEENTPFGLPQKLSDEEKLLPLAALVTNLATLPLTNASAGRYLISLGANQSADTLAYQVAMQEKQASLNFRFWPQSKTKQVGQDFVVFCCGKLQDELLTAEKMDLHLQVVQEDASESGKNFAAGLFRDDGAFPDEIAGDGIFSASFTIPTAGNFVFFARGEITPAPNLKAKVSSFLLGMGSTSASSISAVRQYRALDTNGNGLFDELQVVCELNIDKDASYYLCAELCDKQDERISVTTQLGLELTVGLREVVLTFPGREIFQHGMDGPYNIKRLTLYETAGNMLESPELDSYRGQLASDEYSCFAFEHDPVVLLNTGRDWSIDKDGDGCKEMLCVELDILLTPTRSGRYNWSASLYNSTEINVADAVGDGILTYNPNSYGLNKLLFQFPTASIATQRSNGPYRLGGISLWGNALGNSIYLESTYQTSIYKFNDFMLGANIIDVSESTSLSFDNWQLNPNSGSLTASATLTNTAGKNGAPLELAFWLVLPASSNNRLCRVDGQTETGQDYLDVTAIVEAKLPHIGNADNKLDVGETVQFNVEIFSQDRSSPQAQIFSFWADPPAEVNSTPGPGSTQNNILDDAGILLIVEQWQCGEVDNASLLQAIERWQNCAND